jgi:hypothetical protein
MKTAKFFFAALLLSGSVVATYTPVSASEIPGLLFQRGNWFRQLLSDGDYGTDHAGFRRPTAGS